MRRSRRTGRLTAERASDAASAVATDDARAVRALAGPQQGGMVHLRRQHADADGQLISGSAISALTTYRINHVTL